MDEQERLNINRKTMLKYSGYDPTSTDFPPHGERCAWIRGMPCDCGVQEIIDNWNPPKDG